ncbi:MAG: hypothetical protein IT422_13860 [Pirellulaceae bacterium]|nr:hypothetical protein [Pirellulaceae bacterium]
MRLIHPSNETRNREFEALTITADIVVGFGITDHLDVMRIHEAVLRVLERLTSESARERVLELLGLEDD